MGTTVNQRAAMVVASPSFVSLSGFGAMFSSWPQIECREGKAGERKS
jgi:hypothetical protein